MAELRWTPSVVEERFVEAADVMKRLPEVKVQGYFSTWPKVIHDFGDRVEQEPKVLSRPRPSPHAISRMEETLGWLAWLEPIDAKIVWLRASGERWKSICWKVGLGRTAAHQHWLYALCIIAWRLNGHETSGRRSRRQVIEVTRAVRSETERKMCAHIFPADKSARCR
jgi:hypothetical protein